MEKSVKTSNRQSPRKGIKLLRFVKVKEEANAMKGFKSSESRLVYLFQKSREQWKLRAAEKQKKLRVMEIKVRDLSTSRDQWKAKALLAQQQQIQLEKELEELQKINLLSQNREKIEKSTF